MRPPAFPRAECLQLLPKLRLRALRQPPQERYAPSLSNLDYFYSSLTTCFQAIAVVKTSTPQKALKVIDADDGSDVSSIMDIVHMNVS